MHHSHARKSWLSAADHSDAILAAIGEAFATAEFLPDGALIAANERFLQLFGFKEEQLTGQHHQVFVEATYGESFAYRRFWHNLSLGKRQVQDHEHRRRDGKPLGAKIFYLPIAGTSGHIVKVVALAQDYTRDQALRGELSHQLSQLGDELTAKGQALAAAHQQVALQAAALAEAQHYRAAQDAALVAQQHSNQQLLQAWQNLMPIAQQLGGATLSLLAPVSQLLAAQHEHAGVVADAAAAVAALSGLAAGAAATPPGARELAPAQLALAALSSSDEQQLAAQKAEQHLAMMRQLVASVAEIVHKNKILALNTAIEATRCGSPSVAVIAREMKLQANQTAASMDDLSAQIGDVEASHAQLIGLSSAQLAQVHELATALATSFRSSGCQADGELLAAGEQALADISAQLARLGRNGEQTATAAAAAMRVATHLQSLANLLQAALKTRDKDQLEAR